MFCVVLSSSAERPDALITNILWLVRFSFSFKFVLFCSYSFWTWCVRLGCKTVIPFVNPSLRTSFGLLVFHSLLFLRGPCQFVTEYPCVLLVKFSLSLLRAIFVCLYNTYTGEKTGFFDQSFFYRGVFFFFLLVRVSCVSVSFNLRGCIGVCNGTDQKKANRISMFSFWPVVIFFLPYLRALSRSNVRRSKIPSRCVLSLSNLNKYYFPLLLIIFVLLFLKQFVLVLLIWIFFQVFYGLRVNVTISSLKTKTQP